MGGGEDDLVDERTDQLWADEVENRLSSRWEDELGEIGGGKK